MRFFYTIRIINIYMNGSELREKRKQLKLTQEQLAQELKVTANTIARWERSEMAIPPFLELAIKTIEREKGEQTAESEE